jgi:hypothetical protein
LQTTSSDLLREWNSSPPIVVVAVAPIVIIAAAAVIVVSAVVVVSPAVIVVSPAVIVVAAITTVVSKTISVAQEFQLALNLVPLRRRAAVQPARDTIDLLRFLEYSARFVGAAIQITTVADTRFQIADCIAELVYLVVDSIFTIGAVGAAAIEGAIHLSLKIFRQTIEPVDRIAHGSFVVTSIAAIAGIPVSPLGSRCNRQAEREKRRSEN